MSQRCICSFVKLMLACTQARLAPQDDHEKSLMCLGYAPPHSPAVVDVLVGMPWFELVPLVVGRLVGVVVGVLGLVAVLVLPMVLVVVVVGVVVEMVSHRNQVVAHALACCSFVGPVLPAPVYIISGSVSIPAVKGYESHERNEILDSHFGRGLRVQNEHCRMMMVPVSRC